MSQSKLGLLSLAVLCISVPHVFAKTSAIWSFTELCRVKPCQASIAGNFDNFASEMVTLRCTTSAA